MEEGGASARLRVAERARGQATPPTRPAATCPRPCSVSARLPRATHRAVASAARVCCSFCCHAPRPPAGTATCVGACLRPEVALTSSSSTSSYAANDGGAGRLAAITTAADGAGAAGGCGTGRQRAALATVSRTWRRGVGAAAGLLPVAGPGVAPVVRGRSGARGARAVAAPPRAPRPRPRPPALARRRLLVRGPAVARRPPRPWARAG